MYLLGETDISEPLKTATEFLGTRGDAMVILVAFLVGLGFWIWKVVIPNQTSQRDNNAKLVDIQQQQVTTLNQQAQTLSKLTEVCERTDSRTEISGSTINAMKEIKKIEIGCFKKISEACAVDIKEELAEMHGVIRAIENGVTINKP